MVCVEGCAYEAINAAIRKRRTPNLLVMRYERMSWTVRDLILIPTFAFPASAVIKRKPLSAGARRHGWVGCNFDLRRIAVDARIVLVSSCIPASSPGVRARYRALKSLIAIKPIERGWTLDVLNAVRRLDNQMFSTSDAYGFEAELQSPHPENRNVRPEIRQQLQVLRDMKLLQHLGRGMWRCTSQDYSA